jgi:hypothetical protein
MSGKENKIRVLELFSGIGGMHFSLINSKFLLNKVGATFDYEIVAALDINEGANSGKNISIS